MKSKKSKPLATPKQRFEIFLEDMNEKISFMAEQSTQHTNDIHQVKEILEKHTERFDNIDMQIEFMKEELKKSSFNYNA